LKRISSDDDLKNLFTDDDLEKSFTNVELAVFFAVDKLDQKVLNNKVESLKKLVTIKKLKKLFSAKGMKGMLWTIYLIICAMVFGGIMDAIGGLARITRELLKFATTIFGLFASKLFGIKCNCFRPVSRNCNPRENVQKSI